MVLSNGRQRKKMEHVLSIVFMLLRVPPINKGEKKGLYIADVILETPGSVRGWP